VVVVAAAIAGTSGCSDQPVAAVLADPAHACVHVQHRHAYASPVSSPRTGNTTLACDVRQWRFAETRWC
jgi:hypothetical protein